MTNQQRVALAIAILLLMLALFTTFRPQIAQAALMLRMNLPYNTQLKTVDGLPIPASTTTPEVAMTTPEPAPIAPVVASKPVEVAPKAPVVAPAPVETEYITLPGGWYCEKPHVTQDLLQPSGLWGMDSIDCHKLLMTVEEWRAQNLR